MKIMKIKTRQDLARVELLLIAAFLAFIYVIASFTPSDPEVVFVDEASPFTVESLITAPAQVIKTAPE